MYTYSNEVSDLKFPPCTWFEAVGGFREALGDRSIRGSVGPVDSYMYVVRLVCKYMCACS